ncbi:hypothetical protein DIPPA_24277 [Diplonema papillatum]|nr:hypothetical protein DIPPA_24277 [Diplonema papillatum]|eukprot:gene17415-26772_t
MTMTMHSVSERPVTDPLDVRNMGMDCGQDDSMESTGDPQTGTHTTNSAVSTPTTTPVATTAGTPSSSHASGAGSKLSAKAAPFVPGSSKASPLASPHAAQKAGAQKLQQLQQAAHGYSHQPTARSLGVQHAQHQHQHQHQQQQQQQQQGGRGGNVWASLLFSIMNAVNEQQKRSERSIDRIEEDLVALRKHRHTDSRARSHDFESLGTAVSQLERKLGLLKPAAPGEGGGGAGGVFRDGLGGGLSSFAPGGQQQQQQQYQRRSDRDGAAAQGGRVAGARGVASAAPYSRENPFLFPRSTLGAGGGGGDASGSLSRGRDYHLISELSSLSSSLERDLHRLSHPSDGPGSDLLISLSDDKDPFRSDSPASLALLFDSNSNIDLLNPDALQQ